MRPRAILDRLEPYVPGKRLEDGIKLSSNENPNGPSPRALEAIAGVLDDVHRYPDGGMRTLRATIASRWSVDPAMVVVGNGSDEIMVMIAGALIEPGLNAITGRNTFSQYTFATRIFGGEMRTAPMREGRFDLDAILALVDDATRIVFLCSPNNPTGTVIETAELDRFLDQLPGHVLTVMDEAYGEYANADDYPNTVSRILQGANLVRLRTFSKVYGLAALRVGYGIASAETIGSVERLRQPFNVGTVAQSAATAALSDEEFVAMSLRVNHRERLRVCRFLDEHEIRYYPTQANFVCARFPHHDAASIVLALQGHGIAVRPLSSFGLPDWIRISVGTGDQMDALYAALGRILEA